MNRLLEKQSAIIQGSGGDIDKFVGDAVVAVFSGADAPRSACAAALQIIRLCTRSPRDFDGLAVGIGVSTGSVIHGMIGSSRRADFTVIGDSVNVASRLCGIAKGMQIVVSDSTRQTAGAGFLFKGPYSVKLKGKKELARVWLLQSQAKEVSP